MIVKVVVSSTSGEELEFCFVGTTQNVNEHTLAAMVTDCIIDRYIVEDTIQDMQAALNLVESKVQVSARTKTND